MFIDIDLLLYLHLLSWVLLPFLLLWGIGEEKLPLA
jgi:hypothetical protein